MRKFFFSAIMISVCMATVGNVWAVEADVDGAVLGKWTMDFDAAKELAKAEDLPILMNFSGSDWCGWCKLMEKDVFTNDTWKAYAEKSLIMVLVDFPKDKTLVPERYVERNETIKEEFGVTGFPAFILLDADGKSVLGRLGAGKEKTPESFSGEIKALTRYCAGHVDAFVKDMEPEARAKYLAIIKDMSGGKEAIASEKEKIAGAKARIEEFKAKVDGCKEDATEFRASLGGEEALKSYRKAKAGLVAAEKELEEWLKTKPKRSEETMKQYNELNERIAKLKSEISDI